MNHNHLFAGNRLRGLALLIERGQCDSDLAELGVDLADKREDIAAGIRQIADEIENPDQ